MSTKNYYIDLLPDEPIILSGLYKEFSVVADQPRSDAETRQTLDQVSEPVYLIIDLTEISFSLDELVVGSNFAARGQHITDTRGQSPLWKHPNIKELIFVTDKRLIKLAVMGLDSLAFGNIQAKAFETQEEALAYARARIAEY